MNLTIKDNRNLFNHLNFDLQALYNKSTSIYRVNLLIKDEIVSYAEFKFENFPTRHLNLLNIETLELYQNKKYATAVIMIVEYIAYINKTQNIEALFNPKNYFAEIFFKNKGYVVYSDGLHQYVTKTVDNNYISEIIIPNLTNFSIDNV